MGEEPTVHDPVEQAETQDPTQYYMRPDKNSESLGCDIRRLVVRRAKLDYFFTYQFCQQLPTPGQLGTTTSQADPSPSIPNANHGRRVGSGACHNVYIPTLASPKPLYLIPHELRGHQVALFPRFSPPTGSSQGCRLYPPVFLAVVPAQTGYLSPRCAALVECQMIGDRPRITIL